MFMARTEDSLRASFYYALCQRGFAAYIEIIGLIASMIGVVFVLVTVEDVTRISSTIIFLLSTIDELQWGIR